MDWVFGVLVVEAEKISGTSITARYAKEQGKDTFCLPNSIENKKGIGTNILIQKGAKLVIEPKEIIERYRGKEIEQISIEQLEKRNKKEETNLSKIKEEYRQLYKILEIEELNINEIRIKTKIEISELYQKLFLMEMEGLIENKNNKYKIKI